VSNLKHVLFESLSRKGKVVGDTLTEGQKLQRGDSLTSDNGAYTLTLQQDGNLVLAARGQAVWATGTDGQNVERAEVQTDGNFVLYTPDKPVWHSDTKGSKDVKLVLQDDRNLVLYAKDGPAWSSKTETSESPPPEAREKGVATPEPAGPEVAQAASVAAEPAPAPVPEPAPAPPPPPPPAPRTYTVVSGDTLWAISERFYGDGSKYQVIADASGVSNPDLIHPGQVLTIP
jgi:nucleoid-associated protein YgaU